MGAAELPRRILTARLVVDKKSGTNSYGLTPSWIIEIWNKCRFFCPLASPALIRLPWNCELKGKIRPTVVGKCHL
jgi:hypothetical protein